ncbi:MATE family efflux transporter [Clostridium sp. MCC353]|uniref:MATE family efflux transporter n=1 Tax=Clostridium sp. MCC353 TaxID=2592646 RepID=UPI001C02A322|nr:MATE family efflux transporter [Clostridium sp. MCC353]MBT9776504.1 MATE family efflux transporter [Clostridium sp. MCC353]
MPIIKEKNFYLHVIKLVLPVAVQSLITTGINLMDTVMLGSFGELQLSASALANQFVMLFQIFCMGVGCGAAVLTAQYWGSRELMKLKQVMTLMFRIVLIAGTACMIFVMGNSAWILSVYTKDEQVIMYGVKYMKILQYTLIFYAVSIVSTQVLRSVKMMRIPMYSSCISFFLNIFFNYIFIFGKFGMPRLEIQGAAIGTLAARAFEMCFIMGYILFVDKKIMYRVKDLFRPCIGQLRKFTRYSIPVMVSDMLLGVGNSAVSVVMGHIGAGFVAANSVTNVTSHISTILVMGFATAASSVVGNTLGEGKEERAFTEGITFFFLAVLLGIFGCVLILATSGPILSMYTLEEETVLIARQLMEAIAIIVFFRCTSMILTKGVLRAGGDTRFLMIADIIFLWVISIPLGYMAGLVWHLSAFWIYFALMGHTVLKSVLCIWRLLSKKWMHRIAE